MNIIKENISDEIEVKKSRFIANIIYVQSEDEAKEKIKEIKSKYYDARHNCFAYRVYDKGQKQIIERFTDDGEPSGTAGKPILDLIRGRDLYNCLIVVTRYFGGILLGTGGLVRAYSDASKKVLDECTIVESKIGILYKIEVNYENLKNIIHFCEKENIEITNKEYKENITLTLKSDIDSFNLILNENIIKSEIIEKDIFI